jgi:acetolactate synthase-1/2/3 large subunit
LSAWLPGSKGTLIGNHFCSTADVILAVGVRFADETTSSYRHGVSFSIPPTKLIHIDIDPSQIGKNYPVEIGIGGDAKSVLAQLLEAARDITKPVDYENTPYHKELLQWRKRWMKHLKTHRHEKLNPPTISNVLYKLRNFLDHDAVVATSSGNVQAQVLQEFPFYQPRTNLTTGGFSTMGWAFPAAMGAKLAHPDRRVIALVGDGDFMMTMQEMSTAVQHNIPIVVMVLNNMGWQSIADLQIAALGPDRAINTYFKDKNHKPYSPDFAAIAKSFGMHAQKIDKSAQIEPALKNAFRSGKPALIEVIVNRKYPYSGSPAVGWWDVPIPAYLKKKRKVYEKQRKEERLS